TGREAGKTRPIHGACMGARPSDGGAGAGVSSGARLRSQAHRRGPEARGECRRSSKRVGGRPGTRSAARKIGSAHCRRGAGSWCRPALMASDGDLAGRLHELERLHASLRAITSTLDLGELVRTVLDSIKSVTTPEALSLLLYDPDRDELVFA